VRRRRRRRPPALVLFGVLDELVAAFEEAGLADAVQWSDRIWFRLGRGAPCWIRPAPPPGPMRFGPDLSRFRALSPAERLAAQRALARIVRGRAIPPAGTSLHDWFSRTLVPPRVVDRLFRPLVELAFGRPVEHVGGIEGAAWLRAFFSRSARSARMGILRLPLHRPR
jgi:hypothetical protein